MKWFRPTDNATSGAPRCWTDEFHEWILSLPWVVERPYGLGLPGVRSFVVVCEPLELRQLWLVTGLSQVESPSALGAAIIVPAGIADQLARVDLAQPISPMPAGRVLVRIRDETDAAGIEIAVLEAYASAMS